MPAPQPAPRPLPKPPPPKPRAIPIRSASAPIKKPSQQPGPKGSTLPSKPKISKSVSLIQGPSPGSKSKTPTAKSKSLGAKSKSPSPTSKSPSPKSKSPSTTSKSPSATSKSPSPSPSPRSKSPSPKSKSPAKDFHKGLDVTAKSVVVETFREKTEVASKKVRLKPVVQSGKKVTPAAYKAVDDFVRGVLKLGVFGLRNEFAELKVGAAAPTEGQMFESFAANPTRNKFKDLVCLDATRVILTLEVPPETDYIHASWVSMVGVDKAYIAAQIPLETTVEDFWRMCFQESVKTIVVLCDFFENGVMMFRRYWPESDEIGEYGSFSVEVKKESPEDRITYFTLELSYSDDMAHPITITLIQVTDWTGRSLVECGVNILRVLKRIDKRGCCVVQCVNGIGRTAVVIGVDTINTRLFNGENVKMAEVVQEMRTMRASAIQSSSQYILLASAVLSYIKTKIPNKYQKQVDAFRAELVSSNNAAMPL